MVQSKCALRDERGSVLLLGIGLAIVTLMIATIAINLASVWVIRTHLDSVAEASALAGAQNIETELVYEGVDIQSIGIAPSKARAAIHSFLVKAQASAQFDSFSVESIDIHGNEVSVALSSRAHLPFGYLIGVNSIVINSRASARHLWPSN